MKIAFYGLAIITCFFNVVEGHTKKTKRSVCNDESHIRIAFSGKHSTNDPQLKDNGPNNSIARQVFNSLIEMDETEKLKPSLAESWTYAGSNVWKINLRKGVKFHDGSAFTATDVKFSYDRVLAINSTFKGFLSSVSEIIINNDYELEIRTKDAAPFLPNSLALIPIVSRNATSLDPASSADFDKPPFKGMVGTGPYKWKSGVAGGPMEYTANHEYFDGKPLAEKVSILEVVDDAKRLKMIQDGEVDVIDNIPTAKYKHIKKDRKLRDSKAVTNRVIFLAMDQTKEVSLYVTDHSGNPIKNPFKDIRIRKAFNLLIDREGIATNVMGGLAEPTSQFVSPKIPGYAKDIKTSKLNLKEAKKLISEYMRDNKLDKPFMLTLHSPAGRFVNDVQVATAISEMLGKGGIQTKVETMPIDDFLKKAREGAFSLCMAGWGVATGEGSNPLQNLVYTKNTQNGKGLNNFGGYSNPKLDEAIDLARSTADEAERTKLIQKATSDALLDYAVLPLYHQVTTGLSRESSGFRFKAGSNELVLAYKVKSKTASSGGACGSFYKK